MLRDLTSLVITNRCFLVLRHVLLQYKYHLALAFVSCLCVDDRVKSKGGLKNKEVVGLLVCLNA